LNQQGGGGDSKGPDTHAEQFRQTLSQHMVSIFLMFNIFNKVLLNKKQNVL
jgi:hypothetical protein